MPMIFAHRGFSGNYPENTMLAFEKILETGCTGTELDVQMTSDGELVIIHDESLERTTNGRGFVWEYSLKELQSFFADATFGGKLPNQHIPTLREYFSFIKDTGLITNIELKTGEYEYPGIEKAVMDLIAEFNIEDRIWISSFNHMTILRCREMNPRIRYGLLVNCWIKDVAQYTRELGADTLNASVGYLMVRENVEALAREGIQAQAWTVNHPEWVRRLLDNGVECIITNYPDMAVKVLREWEESRK